MTTDDLQSAAELATPPTAVEIAECIDAIRKECTGANGVVSVIRRMAFQIDNLLAARPADDGEAIDYDWLEIVATRISDPSPSVRFWWFGKSLCLVRTALGTEWLCHGFRMENQPKTRGDVRRLMAALGITLPAADGKE